MQGIIFFVTSQRFIIFNLCFLGYTIKLSRARKLVDNLNERLEALEIEKSNAETYNELNKRKSSLQFCLYKSELEKSNKELDEVSFYLVTTSYLS